MSPEQKVVAVIVPTFNRAELLQRALNSVLTQDVTRGLEVVVVDDGSADDIGRVVKSVADERVRLVRQDNGGVSRARNRGVEETDAEWVCFLDSDDVARAGWLEEMLSAASQGIDLFSCGSTFVGTEGQRTDAHPQQYGAAFGGVTALFLAGSFLVRRRLILQAGGYLAGLRYGENTELGMRIGQLCMDHDLSVSFVDRSLVDINVRPNRYDAEMMLESATMVLEHGRDQLELDRRLHATYMAIAGKAAEDLGQRRRAQRFHASAARTDPAEWRHAARLARALLPRRPVPRQSGPAA